VADVFDEVDEELRRANALKLWKKYSPFVIGAAVAIVLATAGWTFWQDHQRKRSEAEALRFVTASDLAATDADRAIVELRALARDAGPGYAALARFKEAALTLEKDRAKGLDLYRQLAADAAIDQPLRDAAATVAALLSVGEASADEVAKIAATLGAPNGPWRHVAREAEALARLKSGDREAALKIYRSIADDLGAPAALRQRAAEVADALGG
jgi:hypothetical protein